MLLTKTAILGALTLTTTALASPLAARQQDEFYLVTSNDSLGRNGLYIGGYHTGAGTADAVAWPNTTYGSEAFLNGTYLQFALNGDTAPAGLFLESDTNYADWEPAAINSGYGTSGFSLNGANQLVWNSTEFAGWLLCDWYHAKTPQLFYRWSYGVSVGLTSNCGTVDLVAESASY